MSQRSCVFLTLLFTIACGAGVILAREAHTESARRRASSDFQLLVGGLGFGPTTELDACPFDYDPRLECPCASDLGPLPSGANFDPHHAGADSLPKKE